MRIEVIEALGHQLWLAQNSEDPAVRRRAKKTLLFAEAYGHDPMAARARAAHERSLRRRDEYMAARVRRRTQLYWYLIAALQIAIVAMVVVLAAD